MHSHSAEHCGAKGCRIFVHQSAVDDLAGHDDGMLMPMPVTPNPLVSWEVCYLPKERFSDEQLAGKLRPMDQDVSFVVHLRNIQSDSEPLGDDALVQYSETYSAIDRMRGKLHRGVTLREAEATQDKVDNDIMASLGLL